jgi:hypothetical protein
MMMMSVEQSVEWEMARETEVIGENLPQCYCVYHKSHMTWPGLQPGPPEWEAGFSHLTHDHLFLLQLIALIIFSKEWVYEIPNLVETTR